MEVIGGKTYSEEEGSEYLKKRLSVELPENIDTFSNAHVSKRNFGSNSDGESNKFGQVLKLISHVNEYGRVKNPWPGGLSDIDKRLMKLRAYRTVYEIDDKPLNNVMGIAIKSSKENMYSFSPLQSKIDNFLKLELSKHLQLEEFLKLPPYLQEQLISNGRKESLKNAADFNKLNSYLEDGKKNKGG